MQNRYAHIWEKALQHTNVEHMHPAYRDMMLVQTDIQLLNWGKDIRTNEVAAGAAAEELRSKAEGARNRDYGSKKSVGKAAEELGGYFCDGRLQVWTEGSFLDPRWEAIARAGAGVSFSEKQLDAHALHSQNANRPDVSQRRAGGSGVRHPGTGNADAQTHGL